MGLKNFYFFALSLGGIAVIFAGFIAYEFIRTTSLETRVQELSSDLASTSAALADATSSLSHTLSATEQKIEAAKNNIEEVKSQVGGVEQTVGTISGTVGTLQKLSKTDPELLKKYSKVYFLNENYLPANLVTIDTSYLYSERRPEQIRSEVWLHLKSILEDAKTSGSSIYVKSAYRSFFEQASLKSAYSVTYGAGTANQFSADQGYSEHQLGTTVDFITTGLGGQLAGFEKTSSFAWLNENAYKYGFVLSYPKGNSYYLFEPWHWRYVGVALATFLHNQGLYFYNIDQRTIDGFLVNIFD